jgi:hypothetical protein
MILLRLTHESTSDALALLFTTGKSLLAEAKKQRLAATDGAGPSHQKESTVPAAGPTNEEGGKGKKRELGSRVLPPRRRWESKNIMRPVKEPHTIRYVYLLSQSPAYSCRSEFAAVDWCALHPEGTEGDFNRWLDFLDPKGDAMQVGDLDCRSISLTLMSLGVQEEGEGREKGHSQRPLGECNTLHCQRMHSHSPP